MAGTVKGNFNFPGTEPMQWEGENFSPFKPTTAQGKEPKIGYYNATTAAPAAPSSTLSFFRVTIYQPIRIYRVSIHALRLNSTGSYQNIDNLTANLVAFGGSTWSAVSQIPGTYGSINGFNNTVINWTYSPQYGPWVWEGPIYMPANNTIQLTATCYANFAAGDTLSGGVTIHWDTM